MMWWDDGWGMGWGGWLVMTLVMVAFWALVVFGVVALFRGARPGGTPSAGGHPHTPEDLLDERYARGEIDTDEYTARREVLRSAHGHPR